MSVQADDSVKTYPGNGAAVLFDGPRLFDPATLSVTLVDTVTQAVTSPAYSVTRVGANGPSAVLLTVAPPVGSSLILRRTLLLEQSADFTNQQTLLRRVIEATFDVVVMMIQQLSEMGSRSLRIGENVVGVNPVLPTPQSLRPLVWNAAGNAVENGDTVLSGDLLLRGNLAAYGAGAGSDMVAVPAGAFGTTYLQTVSDILNGSEVSLHRFIPKGQHAAIRSYTSTYNATTDIRSALESGTRALIVPAGLHRYDGALTRPTGLGGIKLRGVGSAHSIIRCVGAGALTSAESGESNFGMPRFELEGIRLEAGVANAGTAVRINNTGGSGFAGVGSLWNDVEIVPSAPGNFWNKGVHSTNLRNTRFSRVVVGSNAILGEMTHCFHLDGVDDPVEVWWDGFCYMYVAETGIRVEGAYEGIYLDGINMTSVRDGLIVRPSTAAEPVVHVLNSYINCQRAAVDLDKIAYFLVANNGMSSSGLITGSFHALKTDRSGGSGIINASRFSNNTVIGGNGYVGGDTENGVLVTSGNSIDVFGNTFRALSKGVEFVAGASLREYDNRYTTVSTPVIKPAAISTMATRPEILLRANGNGDAQSVPVNTPTKLTHGGLNDDVGNYFSTSLSRWTPPEGTYRIKAHCAFTTNIADTDILNMEIHKNGANTRGSITVAARGGLVAGSVDALVAANGTDFFEIFVVVEGGGGNRTRSASVALNYWDAEAVR